MKPKCGGTLRRNARLRRRALMTQPRKRSTKQRQRELTAVRERLSMLQSRIARRRKRLSDPARNRTVLPKKTARTRPVPRPKKMPRSKGLELSRVSRLREVIAIGFGMTPAQVLSGLSKPRRHWVIAALGDPSADATVRKLRRSHRFVTPVTSCSVFRTRLKWRLTSGNSRLTCQPSLSRTKPRLLERGDYGTTAT